MSDSGPVFGQGECVGCDDLINLHALPALPLCSELVMVSYESIDRETVGDMFDGRVNDSL